VTFFPYRKVCCTLIIYPSVYYYSVNLAYWKYWLENVKWSHKQKQLLFININHQFLWILHLNSLKCGLKILKSLRMDFYANFKILTYSHFCYPMQNSCMHFYTIFRLVKFQKWMFFDLKFSSNIGWLLHSAIIHPKMNDYCSFLYNIVRNFCKNHLKMDVSCLPKLDDIS